MTTQFDRLRDAAPNRSVWPFSDAQFDRLRDAAQQVEARELAALARLQKFTWRPIEIAPRDRVIMLYRPGAIGCRQVAPGKWDDNEFARHPKGYWQSLVGKFSVREDRDTPPTHWMDLPEPPTLENGNG